MEQIIKYVVGEMRVIAEAPATIAIAVLVMGGVIWWALDWRYGAILVQRDSTISNRDSEIALLKGQRDDYKEKLNGATPDQAKARVDALEARLAAVEPRRLTTDQRTALIARLSPPRGTTPTISIVAEASGDSPQFAADLSGAFRSAGPWNVSEPMAMGIGNRPPSGIAITMADPNSPEVAIAVNAFRAASIPFEIRQAPTPREVAFEILICTKIAR